MIARMHARYAVIDIGTNSVKFHVGETDGAGNWKTVVDRGEVTRLGEGLEAGGEIASAPLERTIRALAAMTEEARAHDVRSVVAVGTAGLRMARNRAAVLAAIKECAGLDVEVLAGDEEARLAYFAAVSALGLRDGAMLVFDTGGGSSQFTFGHGAHVEERFSVNVGAVRYMETFALDRAVTPDLIRAVMQALALDLARLNGHHGSRALIGIGGAITTMAAVTHGMTEYDAGVIQGTVLTRSEVGRQIDLYASMNAHDRRMIAGMPPARADIILAGACIVGAIMEKMNADSVTVSNRGLRHGVLMERFSRAATS
jgi:exopolyphosphatase/guanosine-5'-triphosphate,3'-diphosphate pyrophosphatase